MCYRDCPPLLITFCHTSGSHLTPSARPLLLMAWMDRPTARMMISCQETFTPLRFFDFSEQVEVTWTHIRGVGRMFQYLPSPAAEKVPDNGSGVTPRIVVQDDGARRQQVWSLPPYCWTKVVVQELAVVGSIHGLALWYSVLQYHPIDVIRHDENIFSAVTNYN